MKNVFFTFLLLNTLALFSMDKAPESRLDLLKSFEENPEVEIVRLQLYQIAEAAEFDPRNAHFDSVQAKMRCLQLYQREMRRLQLYQIAEADDGDPDQKAQPDPDQLDIAMLDEHKQSLENQLEVSKANDGGYWTLGIFFGLPAVILNFYKLYTDDGEFFDTGAGGSGIISGLALGTVSLLHWWNNQTGKQLEERIAYDKRTMEFFEKLLKLKEE